MNLEDLMEQFKKDPELISREDLVLIIRVYRDMLHRYLATKDYDKARLLYGGALDITPQRYIDLEGNLEGVVYNSAGYKIHYKGDK